MHSGTSTANSDFQPSPVGVVILPGFSPLAKASALEPLAVANRLAGVSLYTLSSFSLNGQPVSSALELPQAVQHPVLLDQYRLDMLVICAPSPLVDAVPSRLYRWIVRLAAQGTLLVGIAGGGEVLARAGVLDGCRASLARFIPGDSLRIRLSRQLFEIDQNRLTCGGGTAALDMMIALIARQHGQDLAERVAAYFVRERLPLMEDVRPEIRSHPGHTPQSLLEALDLMEANIEEPLTTYELAEHLGISRRQLERLFKKYLQAVPSRYYLNLRLRQARRLLQESDQPVGEIALLSGFSSGAHFSTAYRNHFGISPREERLA